MRTHVLNGVVISVLFIGWSGVLQGQELETGSVDSLLTRGIHRVLLQEYEDADTIFRYLSDSFPGHPAGPLYRAALLQSKALDFNEVLHRNLFDSLLDAGRHKAERVITEMPDRPHGYFYVGTAQGLDSYARAVGGDWFGGIARGLSAVSMFREALQRDSALYDARVGIGTYLYWKSKAIGFLTWLPFISDDREEGILLLKESIARGRYNRFAALSSLIYVYIDREAYTLAAETARTGLEVYPENRNFLWGLATALDRGGQISGAIRAYERLLTGILAGSVPNPYGELVCRLNLSRLLVAEGSVNSADHHLERILALENGRIPGHLTDRAKPKFREARELKTRLAQKNGR
ncbi:MAG: bacterial transcriptional activator domain-containing protein [Bacteroidota bacterium]